MRTTLTFIFLTLISATAYCGTDPWAKDQVMPTHVLAEKLNGSPASFPIILNVGPMENIKSALTVGAMNTEEGIRKLKLTTNGMDRSLEVVVYCGCCSYATCPNIRPAFETLVAMGFKNVKVLNIPEGIKQDWVWKGYPME